tara:strand:- start:462 stop:611 length:150 start_codon:yes stop_codon:yes gene_type:complete
MIIFESLFLEECVFFIERNERKHPDLLIETCIFSGKYQVLNMGSHYETN